MWRNVTSMCAARTAAGSPEPSKGWRPMTEEKRVRPLDDGVSPYLQRPLRTLEKAEHDRRRQRRRNAARKAKMNRTGNLLRFGSTTLA